MKKVLCLLSAAAFLFASCSKDDNDSLSSTSSVLVKKITEFENGKAISRDIKYNGNKIISITETDGSQTKFTYDGNQIVKIEEFDVAGLSDGSVEYGYTNGLMTSYTEKYNEDYNSKTKYVHNTDGTVSYEQFKVNIKTGVEEKFQQTGKLTFKDGNLVKAERSYSNYNSVEIYEYDTKNSPFKNVLGMSLLLDDEPAINNVIKRTYISGSGDNVHTDTDINTYKYDVNNFPTEKTTSFSGSTSSEITQYEY